MSAHPELDAVRIGCVQYLNAAPLIYGCDSAVRFDHPANLAHALSLGALDVALVPVYELFSRPGYRIVDGVSISSRGPVLSVFLAYQGELRDIKSVALDPASLTSSHLIQCLLAEYRGLFPSYSGGNGAARLLIGNQALDFRRERGAAFRYLDLGEEWTSRTGLPFVYALWLLRPETPNPKCVADALRRIKAEGIAHVPEIAEGQRDPAFCEHYLRECVRYDLGEPEKAGMLKFRALLVKYGFVSASEASLGFI